MSIVGIFAAISAANAANLQAVIDDYRRSQDIPGVTAVVVHGSDIVFAGASGMADLASASEMTPDTLLYVGSLSKIFTAILTLNLVERKQLSLTDTLDSIAVDDDGTSAAVSISHILTHASGIPREGDFEYWFTADFPDASALRDYLRHAELGSVPGTELQYSNVAYSALGPVIENASAQSYVAALRSRVLQPLRMHSTGAPGPVDGMANGYSPPGSFSPNAARPFAGIGQQVGDRHVRMYHNAKAMTPAFGIYSSVRDMGRLARFLMGYGGDDVLSKHMRDRMREQQASGWGLGLKVQRYKGHRVARHDGWFAAHRAHILMDVRDSIAIVVMTNGDNASPKNIAEALFDAALEGLE